MWSQRLLWSLLILIPSLGHSECIKVAEANLRAGPTTRSSITWRARKFTPLKRLSRKGNWIKVSDQDGESHWISRKLVSSRLKCAAVKTETANLRSKPSAKAQPAEFARAGRYYPFQITARRGKWTQGVDESGNEFWIFSPLIWKP